MNTLKFKTNLKCSGCVAAVTPYMTKIEGIKKWEVDLAAADKTLTVEGSEIGDEILAVLSSAGYSAVRIA